MAGQVGGGGGGGQANAELSANTRLLWAAVAFITI